ncbi:hypothetical protein HBA55_02095 [Pseudomaricurvus alkylphenolicus]|uniref:VOC family protein n=1 Tax=Pseudomaricurvus alkylphenolicus TaxID=1306991 RepID=UPI0014215811|nr:VOC family protein [Pseudomaricurvus alkylphenolicus]NIB38356.1 hypothetical protein [Pseudomaricurvus alkylphenolicus]
MMMAVSFLKHVALEVPQDRMSEAQSFYTDFGLEISSSDSVLSFRCVGREYECLHIIPGNAKRLHHIAMGTSEEGLKEICENIQQCGGTIMSPLEGYSDDGVWLSDPHGAIFHVVVVAREAELPEEPEFKINSPGNYNRVNEGALPPKSTIPALNPRRLGHVMMFTPDLDQTIAFLEQGLGMRLSDRSQSAVAFLHCQGGSDHHVIALAQSDGIGFHHASFQMGTPDEVGLAGARMQEKWGSEGWGFGRHAIGSNFFHYVRDPWNSYLEYYCDIDYIADSDNWTATNWPLEDSLHTWGPNPPADFTKNYEASEA